MSGQRLVLSDFAADPERIADGLRWRGFSDRVMGGVSEAWFGRDVVGGRRCIRLRGRVTRDRGGGFVQMALDPGAGVIDASAFAGIELLVYGNDESYNVHLRTPDCRWYDESYRHTFHAPSSWQSVRIPWSGFAANGVERPLDTARLERIAVLGWMREFEADIALAALAFYA